jgi:mono/diheme cytochrome c family protein
MPRPFKALTVGVAAGIAVWLAVTVRDAESAAVAADPAWQPAVIPDAVPSEALPDALARSGGTRVARILGPARDFANNCQGCHGHDGYSVTEIPQLLNRVGYFARTREGRAYLIEVPNVAQSQLDDKRLAELMNWLLATYSRAQLPPDFIPYTAEEVGRLRRARIEPATARAAVIDMLVAQGEIADTSVLALPVFRNY